MTDRSNYGPVRRLSPSVSTDNRKPYSRNGLKGVLGTLDPNSGDTAVPTPPDSPYYPFHVEIPQLEPPSQNRTSIPDGPRDVVGFPSYEQYQRIEDEYLSSLSDRKQPKALITQVLFDKIFAVLQNGSEDRASTAQFRFWVRKMFVLAYPQTSFNHNGGKAPEPVVLHDKRPVAIKEQLYEVLCYCHAVARHGGRDKTCATLRLNYSWVPKELTAKFVKACPTCTLKRSGNPDLLSQFGQATQAVPPPYSQTIPAPEPASRFPGGPNDSPPGLSFVVESDGGDDGGGSTGFGRSMFATPDLSVYPSPTLSAGSLGPTTPSPFLPSGLFGYPTMFDPGHGSNLSSMAGWDPSSFSPCDPMYADELIPKLEEPSLSAKEIIDNCARGMQLQLPTPKVVRPLRARARSRGDEYDVRCSADPLPKTESTPGPSDVDNIDPTLLMEGDDGRRGPYLAVARSASPSPSKSGSRVLKQQQQQHLPKFGLALRETTPAMGSGMGASLSADLRMLEPASTPGPRMQQRLRQQRQRQRQLRPPSSEAPPPTKATDACSFGGSVPEFLRSFSFPPPPPSGGGGGGGASASSSSASPPLPPRGGGGGSGSMMNMMVGVEMGGNILLWRGRGDGVQGREIKLEDEDEEAFETKMRVAVEDAKAHRLQEGAEPRWESPEAWLVQSNSIDEASDAVE